MTALRDLAERYGLRLVASLGTVAIAAGGSAACSGAPGSAALRASSSSETDAWSAPPDGQLHSFDDIKKYCAPYFDALPGPNENWNARWEAVPSAGLPPAQVALCHGPVVVMNLGPRGWTREGRDALRQIGTDFLRSYEFRGRRPCPSAAPIPAQLSPLDTHYQPDSHQWDDSGWACMNFAIDQPIWFQYAVKSDASGFVATAHARHTVDGHRMDLTMVLRGTVKDGDLHIVPNIEETWKTLD